MGQKKIAEIMAKLSPNLVTMTNSKVQEAQQIPSKIYTRKATRRHTIAKNMKTNEKILKATGEKKKSHCVQGKSYANKCVCKKDRDGEL